MGNYQKNDLNKPNFIDIICIAFDFLQNLISSHRQTPILRQIDLPNFFTLTRLMLSLLSAIWAIKKNFYAALIGIVYAGFTELLDGVIARNLM